MSIPPLIRLHNILFNEDECIQFLFDNQIFYNSIACSNCGSRMACKMERKAWRCNTKQCRREISIKKDSFFYKQVLSCSEILFIGYLWLQKLKVTSIQSMTGHSRDTITAHV